MGEWGQGPQAADGEGEAPSSGLSQFLRYLLAPHPPAPQLLIHTVIPAVSFLSSSPVLLGHSPLPELSMALAAL